MGNSGAQEPKPVAKPCYPRDGLEPHNSDRVVDCGQKKGQVSEKPQHSVRKMLPRLWYLPTEHRKPPLLIDLNFQGPQNGDRWVPGGRE